MWFLLAIHQLTRMIRKASAYLYLVHEGKKERKLEVFQAKGIFLYIQMPKDSSWKRKYLLRSQMLPSWLRVWWNLSKARTTEARGIPSRLPQNQQSWKDLILTFGKLALLIYLPQKWSLLNLGRLIRSWPLACNICLRGCHGRNSNLCPEWEGPTAAPAGLALWRGI